MEGKSKREIVCILAAQGKKTKEIAKITGLNRRTVNLYKGIANNPGYIIKNKIPLSTKIEWTEAVNRIRRAYGKEPFPMP